ncbi:MAG: hypothetical protein JNJ86_00220 [Chitinophagaceae bacterium]|nr:hypothetical protein [Chitinophagaceae bacterium]
MKSILFSLSLLFLCIAASGQENKVVKKAEKINAKSQEISRTSEKVKEQANQVATNTKTVVQNVKSVIKIFEPIFAIHFKKKNKGVRKEAGTNNEPVDNRQAPAEPVLTTAPVANNNTGTPPQPVVTGEYPPVANTASAVAQQAYSDPGVPENQNYNPDGSANWGNQHNAEYGCYLDAVTGTVLFGGDAEESPTSVDLIFLAPNDGQNTYYLVTPGFAHDGSADCFWGSCTTNNPTRSWKNVNESEVALTNMTGAQFEKIQYNTQLSGAVKNARGFAGWYSSPGSKLDGKVFAVKTEMENRTAYALIYVVKHVGTSGSSGHLKIKIKVTGFDNNGDGNPDVSAYEVRNN